MNSQQLVGLILIPVTSIGVICNWLVVIAILKGRSLSHSFSLLTANQAVINGIHSTIFLFYVTPTIVLQSDLLIAYSSFFGFILSLTYDASIHSHFLISVNRFCAVYMPITYKTSFSLRWTKTMISVSIILSIAYISFNSFILPCKFLYSKGSAGFRYYDAPVCQYPSLLSLGKLITFSIINMLCDVMTMLKVQRFHKVSIKSQGSGAKNQKTELGFIKQSFSQSLFSIFYIITISITLVVHPSPLVLFLVGTVLWTLIHSLNGVFTLKFNSIVWNSLRKPETSQNVVSSERKVSSRASLIGVICNWLVVIAMLKGRSLRHSFSLLTANQAVINGVHSTLFLFYATPMIVLQSDLLIAYSAYCGLLLSICYDASIHSHFLISMNRFCAVYMPVTYKISFSPRWTKTMIIVLILLSITVTLITAYILPCRFFYIRGDTGFNYSEDPVCLYPSFGNLAKLILFSVFNMICDTVTISRVRKVQKVFIKSQCSGAKNQKTELGFIKQSFSQSLFSIIFILTILSIQFMEPNQLVIFLVGTLLFTLVHSLNGVLTLKYNLVVRNSLRKPKMSNESVASLDPRSSKI